MRSRRFASSALLMCALMLAFIGAGFAQTGNQGSVQGNITDPTGAVVAGATISAVNQETGATQETKSTGEGYYTFPILTVGTYAVKVESAGFAATTAKNVQVSVGGKLTLDVKLKVATGSDTVTVSDTAPLIETSRTQQATTVGQEAIDKLPVNGRNFIDYALLS